MDKFDTEVFHKHLRDSAVLGRKFVYTDMTGSTMDDARRLAHDVTEYPHGTVVMSERQSKARGAKDHTWDATNTGNIYASVVLHRPPFCKTFEGSFDLEVAACLAVWQVVKEFGVTRVQPKWPNDLWIRGHKLAGFLVEDGRFDIPGSTDCLFILGIGINVNADVRRSRELQSIATSMVCERGGQYVDREKFLAEVCGNLECMLANKKEDLWSRFVRENLFQENCPLSVSNLSSGKVLDGKFMAICKNWDVKFVDPQTQQTFKGSSEIYSIRPKVMRKVMVVFSSQHNSNLMTCLSKWLTAVIDTSRYVVCLIPEDSITAGEEWKKNCSLLVLVEGVSNPDLVASRLHCFLRSGGRVMASGKGAVFLANILHIPVKQVLLEASDDAALVPVRLKVNSALCLRGASCQQNASSVKDNAYSVQSVAQSESAQSVAQSESVQSAAQSESAQSAAQSESVQSAAQSESAQSAALSESVQSVAQSKSTQSVAQSESTQSSWVTPGTVIFPADPKCFHFLESSTCDGQLADSQGELCLLEPAVSLSVIADKMAERESQVRAYIHNDDSQQGKLTVFTASVKSGGHVALWGLDIRRGVDTRGVNAADMKAVEGDRYKRDNLLQQVLETLLTS